MAENDPLRGALIAGRYRLGRLLGEGQNGRIYAATDSQEHGKCAVKALHPELCSDAENVARFERAFRATLDLDHKGICRSWDLVRERGRLFMVMELLDGKPLTRTIETHGRLDPPRALHIAGQIAEALHAAHERDVTHRNVNPSNVLMLKRGGLKLLDFGASDVGSTHGDITAVGVRMGDATYMAPEYVLDDAMDHRVDLYGLGCVLFEMLTGQPPFVGPSLRVMDDHVRSPPPVPSDSAAGIPVYVDEIVLSLLAKKPEDRPESAAAAAVALREAAARSKTDDRWAPSSGSGHIRVDSLIPVGVGTQSGAHDQINDSETPKAPESQAVFIPARATSIWVIAGISFVVTLAIIGLAVLLIGTL